MAFAAQPPMTKKLSVEPPRTLAKEFFNLPTHGAPMPPGRGASPAAPPSSRWRCRDWAQDAATALRPEDWFVAGHAADDSMIHVMAPTGFEHAIYQTRQAERPRSAETLCWDLIAQEFSGRARFHR